MNKKSIVTLPALKRAIKVMKITVLLLCVCLSQAIASSYAQTTSLSVSAKNETLESILKKIEKQAFMHAHNLTKITLPDGLETIGDEAFDGCRFKKAIVLPASIKSIGKKAFYGYSYYGSGTLGAYFLGAAPQIVGTLNANCSFPSDWTLF